MDRTRRASNTLAVKVTPERALQDIDGVELADSWYDWINWNYLGYQGPGKNPANGNSFVPDRNAGIWKPVYLKVSGAVVAWSRHGQHRTPVAANGFRAADDLHQPAQYVRRSRCAAFCGRRSPGRASPTSRSSSRSRCRRRAARGQLHPRRFAQLTVAQPGPVVALHPRPAQPL